MKTWKRRELEVARWFKRRRNPLSGGSNTGDDGKPRAGDVIHPTILIEVKKRKSHAMISRAVQTQKEARKLNKPWIHFEFNAGNVGKGIVAIAIDSCYMRNLAICMEESITGIDNDLG